MNDRPTLFIDTCALRNKPFLKWLRSYTGHKKISVLTYMEYLTWLIDNGNDENCLKKLLRDLKVDVENFKIDEAVLATQIISNRPIEDRRCIKCKQINWNDIIIAAQGIKYMSWIVTENINDFPSDPSYNVVNTTHVMNDLADFSFSTK